jgi:hypothetical protein
VPPPHGEGLQQRLRLPARNAADAADADCDQEKLAVRESPVYFRTAGRPQATAPAAPPARPVEPVPNNPAQGAGEATALQMVGMIWASVGPARHRSRD